ncbi:hypothetical protein BJX64DRAFT_293439 [Aspergillus heterothallicus]
MAVPRHWNQGASTAHDIWVGHVITAPLSKCHNARDAKDVLEQFVVTTGRLSETFDAVIGHHPGKKEWQLFARVRIPEDYLRLTDNVQYHKGTQVRANFKRGLVTYHYDDVPDLAQKFEHFDPGADKAKYHAAIDELEQVSHVMIYQWLPFLLKKDDKVVRHDYNTYKALLHLDLGGVSKIMDRLKSEDDEEDEHVEAPI